MTFGFDVFTWNREREMSHESYEFTMTLHEGFENSKAVVGVVKCNSFDTADKFFRYATHARIILHNPKDPMRTFWYGIKVAAR